MGKGFIKLSHDWNSFQVYMSVFAGCHALNAIVTHNSTPSVRDLKSYGGWGGEGGGAGLTKPDNDNILYFPNIKLYI